MKTFVLEANSKESNDEVKKFDELNEGLDRFHEAVQGEKTPEEADELIKEFNEFVKDGGPAFELKVLPAIDGSTVVGATKAAALLFGFFQNMSLDQVKECFKACANAFSAELERQINMNKVDHQIH